MSYIEYINDQVAKGEISNDNALELKTHYYSLSQDEKSKIDLKYQDLVDKNSNEKVFDNSSKQSVNFRSGTNENNSKLINQKKINEELEEDTKQEEIKRPQSDKKLHTNIQESNNSEDTGGKNEEDNTDTSLINTKVLKQAFYFNPDKSYLSLLKEILINLLPLIAFILIILLIGPTPPSNIPDIVTTIFAWTGVIIFVYSIVAVLGFIKTILVKVFRRKSNLSK